MPCNLIITFFFIFATHNLSLAQPSSAAHDDPLQSIDGIVHEMLDLISGEPGEARDFEDLRALFLPTARLTILNHSADMPQAVESVSLDEFLELMQDAYYEAGFHEYETGKVVDEYNGIAQVFQSYHARDSEGEEGRGITSYQLAFAEGRWWIVSVLWTGDGNGVEVPGKYLEE